MEWSDQYEGYTQRREDKFTYMKRVWVDDPNRHLKYLIWDNSLRSHVGMIEDFTKKWYDKDMLVESVLTFESFKQSLQPSIYDGEFVSNYVIDITTDNDIPHFFIDNYIRISNFKLVELEMSDLINSDQDFAEYLS